MDLNEQDIAQIEAWLQGELKGEELKTFEQRLANDPDFAAEAEAYRDVLAAVKESAKRDMKKQLAGIQGTLLASGAIQDYSPGKGGSNGGGSSSSGGSGIIGKIILLAIIAGGAYLWYTGKLDPYIERTKKHFYKEKVIRVDTVWKEIRVPAQPASPAQKVIRYDTIRKELPGTEERSAEDSPNR